MRGPRAVLLAAGLALALAPHLAAASAPPAPCEAPRLLLLEGLGTPEEDALRLAELVDRAPARAGVLRRGGAREGSLCLDGEAGRALAWAAAGRALPAGERWIAALPLRSRSVWNSAYPAGGHDGLLWAGRGFSTMARAGLAWRWGVLSGALAPEVAWQANEAYRVVPTGRPGRLAWADPFYGAGIDLPQRFGRGAYGEVWAGQSHVRLDAFGVALGVSTENLWIGPGVRSALLLTDEARGFPHAFVGTSRPVDVWIGDLEALAVWGRLERSRFAHDRSPVAFSVLALGLSPRWIPGLHLGAARGFAQSWASFRDDGFLSVLEPPVKHWLPGYDNPDDNQIASLWYRWTFAPVGLELWGEWGRDDFPIIPDNLLPEPRRTQGWVLGLQKVFPAGSRLVRLQLEWTRLHDLVRPDDFPAFYTHGRNLSWTSGGQLLGARVGPGGIAHWVAVDVLGPGGRIGAFAERLIRNEVIFYREVGGPPSAQHDAELEVGVRQLLRAGPVEVAWELAWAYRWSRLFLEDARNLRAGLELSVPLGGR